ncbi:MAG: T9SS type A sorting domain-containing protein [Candidatus Tenebribacter davisii]|nr:T9SS type A sorting domain-containing protein [Candidatus Tenebribacter davisii]
MKKFMWVLFLISVVAGLSAQSYQGSIATTDFVTGLTLLMPDGVTPVPDGTLCQIMLPGVDGIIDAPNPDGTPGGDDLLVTGVPGNNYFEFPWDSSWTGMPGQLYTPIPFLWNAAGQGSEPTANAGENIYLRLFDTPVVAGSANFLNSALFLLPAAFGELYFNTTAHWDFGTAFNWQALSSGPPIIDWGDGMTGSIDVGVPSLPGSGYGTGLPHEDLLVNPANVGYYFTLTIDDGAPVLVTICLDLTTLGYTPYNLAYWVNDAWVYVPPSGPVTWTADCVSFTLDPTSVVRGDVDIPIVFSNGDGPLPVILSNFTTAIFANEFVEISWTTQTESNMSLWNLHREYQGSNIIIHTEAATNTTVTHDYMFQDAEVINGETYTYYLEAISYDGTSQLWGPVNATMEGNGTNVPLPGLTELIGNHPNPFNPDTFINFNVKENETATLSIFNTKGQVVMNRTFEPGYHNYNWQADTNSSGVYFYKLQSESHTSVKKMLLLK